MKGGVGKTAAAVNLSYLAASEGASTLLCDLDPQGASTYYFRIRASKRFLSSFLISHLGKSHFVGHAAEETKLNEATLPRIRARELLERFINR